jgi:hypothetical protein
LLAVVDEVIVHEMLLHLARDEGADHVFEVDGISSLNEKLEFVASELRVAPVLLLN